MKITAMVTPMLPGDMDDVMAIERQCFKDPWSRRMYLIDLAQNDLATYLVLRSALETVAEPPEAAPTRMAPVPPTARLESLSIPRVLAYGGFWLLIDEAHIATIATHPLWRGCGLGQWMMTALLQAAIERGAIRSTLEVRTGNIVAQRLYTKLGYEVVGDRPRYYRDGEDGLILTTPPFHEPQMQRRLNEARSEALVRAATCFERGGLTP